MNAKFWTGFFLVIILSIGCATHQTITVTKQEQKNIAEIEKFKTVSNNEKQLLYFRHDLDLNEHLRPPILKLDHDKSPAEPCKLAWVKNGKEDWHIFMVDNDNQNEEPSLIEQN